jgi:hypothetical protein
MKDAKQLFATRLKKAMEAAGYEAKPAVLEREFNLRYMGAPLTLHGVRRWLLGEVLPQRDKLIVLDQWLDSTLRDLRPNGPDNAIQQARGNWQASLPAHEKDVVDAYLALSIQQRKIVREVILAFAAQGR